MVFKIEETPELRSHPLTVIINRRVNIKTAFKFMELEKKYKGKLILQIRDVGGSDNDFKDVLPLLS